MNIIRIEETTSTNVELQQMMVDGYLEEGTVLVAGNQTSGRGQAGSFWESEPGKNLLFSILLYPEFLNLKQRFLLSELTANSIKQVLDNYIDHITIKWPNDIYYQDKKIAGILIENEISENKIKQSVIGIGINVNQEIFSDKIPEAISLKQILGGEIDLDLLLDEIVNQLLSDYEKKLIDGEWDDVRQYYHDSLYRKSGMHVFSDENGKFKARIDSVADDGVLSLVTETGEIRPYLFKEVSYDR
ncbi:MAG: biotin--[acetyl-CoA-carboxylase] ligase [Dysgonamonadaceae bacterium]|jgi:BirA family biotin operon repressor/biotin-[acetyl-CoA-carboxylase] ligase|nr:biotin--[acetyl-CoA-carboxylase] ligase [Dysgonamonadaceae bacterium]